MTTPPRAPLAGGHPAVMAAIAEITPAAVAELIERDRAAVVVDVNPRRIYDESHVPGARWMSSSSLRFGDLPEDRDMPVVFYCYNEMCGASHQAATTAVERGWRNVSRMPAGIVGWRAAGLPVEPPEGTTTTAQAVGCTLDTGGLLQRTAEFESLFRRALLRRDATDTTATWTFAWSPQVEQEVRALAAAESGCCSFFRFDIARDGDELRWTISAPASKADAVAMLDRLARDARRP